MLASSGSRSIASRICCFVVIDPPRTSLPRPWPVVCWQRPLELRLARGAREGDHVADVVHAGEVLDGPLEAEAETRVRHRAVPSEIAVPPVVLLAQPHLGQAL